MRGMKLALNCVNREEVLFSSLFNVIIYASGHCMSKRGLPH